MSMNEQDALRWIADLFEESPDRITATTPRADIPAWDSLGVLTLMAGLDEKFGVVLKDGELQRMQSVKDLLDLLRQHGKLPT